MWRVNRMSTTRLKVSASSPSILHGWSSSALLRTISSHPHRQPQPHAWHQQQQQQQQRALHSSALTLSNTTPHTLPSDDTTPAPPVSSEPAASLSSSPLSFPSPPPLPLNTDTIKSRLPRGKRRLLSMPTPRQLTVKPIRVSDSVNPGTSMYSFLRSHMGLRSLTDKTDCTNAKDFIAEDSTNTNSSSETPIHRPTIARLGDNWWGEKHLYPQRVLTKFFDKGLLRRLRGPRRFYERAALHTPQAREHRHMRIESDCRAELIQLRLWDLLRKFDKGLKDAHEAKAADKAAAEKAEQETAAAAEKKATESKSQDCKSTAKGSTITTTAAQKKRVKRIKNKSSLTRSHITLHEDWGLTMTSRMQNNTHYYFRKEIPEPNAWMYWAFSDWIELIEAERTILKVWSREKTPTPPLPAAIDPENDKKELANAEERAKELKLWPSAFKLSEIFVAEFGGPKEPVFNRGRPSRKHTNVVGARPTNKLKDKTKEPPAYLNLNMTYSLADSYEDSSAIPNDYNKEIAPLLFLHQVTEETKEQVAPYVAESLLIARRSETAMLRIIREERRRHLVFQINDPAYPNNNPILAQFSDRQFRLDKIFERLETEELRLATNARALVIELDKRRKLFMQHRPEFLASQESHELLKKQQQEKFIASQKAKGLWTEENEAEAAPKATEPVAEQKVKKKRGPKKKAVKIDRSAEVLRARERAEAGLGELTDADLLDDPSIEEDMGRSEDDSYGAEGSSYDADEQAAMKAMLESDSSFDHKTQTVVDGQVMQSAEPQGKGSKAKEKANAQALEIQRKTLQEYLLSSANTFEPAQSTPALSMTSDRAEMPVVPLMVSLDSYTSKKFYVSFQSAAYNIQLMEEAIREYVRQKKQAGVWDAMVDERLAQLRAKPDGIRLNSTPETNATLPDGELDPRLIDLIKVIKDSSLASANKKATKKKKTGEDQKSEEESSKREQDGDENDEDEGMLYDSIPGASIRRKAYELEVETMPSNVMDLFFRYKPVRAIPYSLFDDVAPDGPSTPINTTPNMMDELDDEKWYHAENHEFDLVTRASIVPSLQARRFQHAVFARAVLEMRRDRVLAFEQGDENAMKLFEPAMQLPPLSQNHRKHVIDLEAKNIFSSNILKLNSKVYQEMVQLLDEDGPTPSARSHDIANFQHFTRPAAVRSGNMPLFHSLAICIFPEKILNAHTNVRFFPWLTWDTWRHFVQSAFLRAFPNSFGDALGTVINRGSYLVGGHKPPGRQAVVDYLLQSMGFATRGLSRSSLATVDDASLPNPLHVPSKEYENYFQTLAKRTISDRDQLLRAMTAPKMPRPSGTSSIVDSISMQEYLQKKYTWSLENAARHHVFCLSRLSKQDLRERELERVRYRNRVAAIHKEFANSKRVAQEKLKMTTLSLLGSQTDVSPTIHRIIEELVAEEGRKLHTAQVDAAKNGIPSSQLFPSLNAVDRILTYCIRIPSIIQSIASTSLASGGSDNVSMETVDRIAREILARPSSSPNAAIQVFPVRYVNSRNPVSASETDAASTSFARQFELPRYLMVVTDLQSEQMKFVGECMYQFALSGGVLSGIPSERFDPNAPTIAWPSSEESAASNVAFLNNAIHSPHAFDDESWMLLELGDILIQCFTGAEKFSVDHLQTMMDRQRKQKRASVTVDTDEWKVMLGSAFTSQFQSNHDARITRFHAVYKAQRTDEEATQASDSIIHY